MDADHDSLTARKLLKSMSVKQGRKYDSPESAADIRSFIQFHNLNISEIRDPIDSFSAILSHSLQFLALFSDCFFRDIQSVLLSETQA